MRPFPFLPALALLAGCSTGLQDPTFATGSRTVVSSSDHDALYAVNVDEGTVSQVEVATGHVTELAVGREPTRIARADGRVYVTLRAERGIAVLEEQGGALTMVDRFDTGAEPYGIVAREDGTRLYVALSMQDEVQELDAATGEVLRTFAVSGQPSWVALHPSGKTLYVASMMGGTLSWLDLRESAPTVETFTFPELLGGGEDGADPLVRRLTGDVAFDHHGRQLAVPGLWLDNTTPTSEPDDGTVMTGSGYASANNFAISRINPGIAFIDTDSNGQPRVEASRVVFVAGVTQDDAMGNTSSVRSYLTSTTWAPDGETVYAPMEGSNTVVAVSATPVFADDSLCGECTSIRDTGDGLLPFQGGFAQSAMVFIGTGTGPKGVAFTDNEQAWVHAWLDRSVAGLRASTAQEQIAQQFNDGFSNEPTFLANTPVVLAQPSLPENVEEGRRLFYSATLPQMTSDGAGVSCATCHMDGRNDGLTWPLDVGARQTPSLAGKVSTTAPVTWTSNVRSPAAEAEITSQGRMGGNNITDDELDAIAAYIDFSRHVDVPRDRLDPASVARGQAIFERADVGCAQCHSGASYTDNQNHDLYGLVGVNTPGLVGIAATAPYLHDGSAPTLRAVLETGRTGQMGDTSMLSEAEMDDLEAYVQSL